MTAWCRVGLRSIIPLRSLKCCDTTVFHSSCCFRVENSQCYFYTSWSLLFKNGFQWFHLVHVVGFGILFVYSLLFYFRTSAFIFPATKGLMRINHQSSILTFKVPKLNYTLKAEHVKVVTFPQFTSSSVTTNKSNHTSEKKLNYYSWTGRTTTIGK